jgi:hypothetical protein
MDKNSPSDPELLGQVEVERDMFNELTLALEIESLSVMG